MGSELELELDLGSVCRRLDQELLRYLEDVERLGERRERLERLMEQGWFSLSKARYSMGNKLVSSLQYGPEMVPLARVDVSQKQDGHHGFSIKRVDSSEVQTAGLNEDKHLKIEEIGPKVLAESPQVRQRKSRREQAGVEEEWREPMGEGTPRGSEGLSECTESPARGAGRSASLEPLRWFGILVPQSLKFAQTSFQEVMELAAEVATLQNRLVCGREQYRHLLQQKHKLVQPHTA